MSKTKIQWADRRWNPVTGCTKISQGCKHCYAATMAKRFWGDRKFSDVQFHKERLTQPERFGKKPQFVFVNSMSDLFHEKVSFSQAYDIVAEMAINPMHTFMILTKRPERALRFFNSIPFIEALNNIWLIVSVEDQQTADERIPLLLQIQAAKRGISLEPMLGPVDIEPYLHDSNCNEVRKKEGICICNEPREITIDWVICGGESGPGARPMNPYWVRSIRDQCKSTGTPFWFKQWGRQHKGNELDGKIWEQRPDRYVPEPIKRPEVAKNIIWDDSELKKD